jgi:pimeloyl-ACP methyl ester carboxylesterase
MRAFLLVLCSLALAVSVIAQGLQLPLAMYLTSADGTTIYAEAQGNASAPPGAHWSGLPSICHADTHAVIFAHGIFGTALVFDGLFSRADLQKAAYLVRVRGGALRQWRANYGLQIRYDARGHGRSGKPTDAASYESVRYAQDVETVVKAFNLTMPFFAGWSLGGVIFADIVDVCTRWSLCQLR